MPKYTECGVFLKKFIMDDDVAKIYEMGGHRVDFNEKKLGFNPLCEAVRENKMSALRGLLTNGADPAPYNNQAPYQNPFCLAASKGNVPMISAMMDHHTPDKILTVAMLTKAIQNKQNDVILFMFDREMFKDFYRFDAAMVSLATHPTMHFPGKTRQLVRDMYYGEDIKLEKYDIMRPPTRKKIEKLRNIHKDSVQRMKSKTAQKAPLQRRPKR